MIPTVATAIHDQRRRGTGDSSLVVIRAGDMLDGSHSSVPAVAAAAPRHQLPGTAMDARLARAITRAASTQTFYTIGFLADRPRVDDAYRAYAYFRWVDDILDAEAPEGSPGCDAERAARVAFLDRQRSLLDRCLGGDPPRDADPHEMMLVDLFRHADPSAGGLEAYLRNMMLVMDFDAGRRGRLVSQADLDEYTRRLAVAVTEAMHHFIGHGAASPHDETRYAAVSGAHVLHMLRDTYADLRAGYVNVPREVLEANGIGPADVHSDAYRAWVAERVRLARADLDAGRRYFSRVRSRRHRLAGLAYIARFEWLVQTLAREGYRLRPAYDERRSLATGLRMGRLTVSWMTGVGASATRPTPIAAPDEGRS